MVQDFLDQQYDWMVILTYENHGGNQCEDSVLVLLQNNTPTMTKLYCRKNQLAGLSIWSPSDTVKKR